MSGTTAFDFLGKLGFVSGGTGRRAALVTLVLHDGEGVAHYYPAMQAGNDPAGLVTVYGLPDGTCRLQLEGRWFGISPDSGGLHLQDDLADAAALRLAGEPLGQSWEICVEGKWRPVVFYPQTSQAVLTVNWSTAAEARFAPTLVTPSMAALAASKQGRGVDLSGLYLEGVRAPGVDFSGARFNGSSLQGADLSGCLLGEADFSQARLTGVSFDNALLDSANLSGAILGPPSWGEPASARQIDLSHCQAAGAVLGSTGRPLDCSGANLSDGDFTQADLYGLKLTGARLENADLRGCRLDGALLDGANLTGVFALKASLRHCSLKNIVAGNANFTAADFTSSVMTQALLDGKTRLFSLAAGLADSLKNRVPDKALVAAFLANGVSLPADLPIRMQIPQRRWQLGERGRGYLLLRAESAIEVFQNTPLMRPAIFYQANCTGTSASGAHLAGADLRGVQWCGPNATLDNADLEGAALSSSLLESLDLSQAFLSGADLSNSVLVNARLSGCTILADSGSRAFSLDGAQIQGADFHSCTLADALLIDAGVALDPGVPLFTLPLSAWDDLTPERLSRLIPAFAQAGYPLGSAPTLESGRQWLLDNAGDADSRDPKVYAVRQLGGRLEVFDGEGGAGHLFTLPAQALLSLDRPVADGWLVDAFDSESYGLADHAPISKSEDPRLKSSPGAAMVGPFGYTAFRLARRQALVQVFGVALLWLRDWGNYPGGLAFKATDGLAQAMSAGCIGPAGYPRQALDDDSGAVEAFFSAMSPPS